MGKIHRTAVGKAVGREPVSTASLNEVEVDSSSEDRSHMVVADT